MGWYILANIFKIFLTLFHLGFRSDRDKDLEILQPVEKVMVALLANGRDEIKVFGQNRLERKVTCQAKKGRSKTSVPFLKPCLV